ncbi:MAG TPA: hypothetical protein VK507_15715 [Iamia sp.]|nr:hypothetical protein [Iamia sp.]
MTDYGCHPIWLYDDGLLQDNVSPEQIGVSSDLAERLRGWAARYDAILNRSDPGSTSWSSEADERSFVATGQRLAQAVADELDERVTYFRDGSNTVVDPRGQG